MLHTLRLRTSARTESVLVTPCSPPRAAAAEDPWVARARPPEPSRVAGMGTAPPRVAGL